MQAKWALDATGISYKLSPYGFSPFYLGELPFRWRIGKLFERITAPMMFLPADEGESADVGGSMNCLPVLQQTESTVKEANSS
jgi:hypothetical protein